MKLEQMYQEVILDHYRNPMHSGLREPFGAEVHHVNPTCGDELTLRLRLSEDGKNVEDVSYDAQGCSISQASASMMADLVTGQSVRISSLLSARMLRPIFRSEGLSLMIFIGVVWPTSSEIFSPPWVSSNSLT